MKAKITYIHSLLENIIKMQAGGGGNTKETSPYADKVKFINTGEANFLTGCKFKRSSILTGYFSSRQYLQAPQRDRLRFLF